MASATKVTVTYASKSGLHFSIGFHVSSSIVSPTNPVVLQIVDYLNACTCGVPIRIEISRVNQPTGTVATGVPFVSEDKAQFRFTDDIGLIHRYKVPGFKTTILTADDLKVNLANSLVVAYTGAVTTYVKGAGGDAVTSIIEAHRVENRKRLKR